MTLGEKIKMLRSKSGLTQKDLADEMHVTFQTVSKWENNENEPDISTLREMAKLFSCSMDYLLSPEEKEIEVTSNGNAIHICARCGKEIPESELVRHTYQKTHRHGIRNHTTTRTQVTEEYHKTCFEEYKKAEEEERKRDAQMRKEADAKHLAKIKRISFGWGIALGIVAFIIALLIFVNKTTIGTFVSILLSLLIGYGIFGMFYCIISGSYVGEVFVWCATLSIKFPGLIFSWDLDGFAWLIAMKILFAIIGFLVGVLALIFAIVLSAAS